MSDAERLRRALELIDALLATGQMPRAFRERARDLLD
ncbi:MAG: hypothetical protein QOD77_400 [Thermoplasmata archaeon]|jgi:hypothetical protein|nr:hypothetical protein [Thermoplasmata archaeon]